MVVALRKESVDRNKDNADTVKAYAVALRKESVDRNVIFRAALCISAHVALRKESVDRNEQQAVLPDKAYSRSPQGERG